MNDVVIASTEADARAVEAVEEHHAALAGALGTHVERLLVAASGSETEATDRARDGLVAWCRTELVPHAQAEEKTLYPAAHGYAEARMLVDAMIAEHGVITGLVDELAAADDGVRAAAAAKALQVLFSTHLVKENEQILPVLASAPEVSLAGLLGGMHELLGGHEHSHEHGHEHGHSHRPAAGHGGHDCTCGEVDGPGFPELDARMVPHAIRHATIFGALDAVGSGGGLVLVAPHDPLPLLAQVEHRYQGRFDVSYLERGPEAWRLLFQSA
ncbi:MAG TPA: DUF2249 domain-containing protein [Marmoricola sp.]|nr:DUF2249 domain-containing protein [Marmoricola sp.]